MTQKSGVAKGYVHGFNRKEQDRLYKQARSLEPFIFSGVDFKAQSHIIEIGSGVGAQTEILLERFPHLRIEGVDASETQVSRARAHLKSAVKQRHVKFRKADALKLPFKKSTFDGAFVCWLLEHVSEPLGILKEAHRVLKPSGKIICNEVLNATFFVHPYSPATLTYWFNFNDHQWALGGDPFVGAKLGNYLMKSGFRDIETKVCTVHYDNREPERRARFVEDWAQLLLSGAPALIEAKKVDATLVKEMTRELKALKKDPDAVMFYSWMQATAYADKTPLS